MILWHSKPVETLSMLVVHNQVMVLARSCTQFHMLHFLCSYLLKLQFIAYLEVKNDPKYIFEKIHNQCSKLSACLSSIQNGKLVIMFLIPVVLVDFHGRFSMCLRHYVT